MSTPLNPVLYERLIEEFGVVQISNDGSAAVKTHGWKMTTKGMKYSLQLTDSGEYYRVNCPKCGDGRRRLWINHLWGVIDELTGSKNLWLAVCYNEDCLSRPGVPLELYERIYGFKNSKVRGRQVTILPGVTEDERLQEVKLPGLVLPINKLHPTDKAVIYLKDRGLDLDELVREYQISYCVDAYSDYPLATGRIVIPIMMNNAIVGWQCRYPGELDWSTTPKYYSRRGMPRRLMLYNYDNAKKYPFVAICEGPTDVWNVGPYAVAAFGKNISNSQLQLLCETWADGAIVILLDGDAWDMTEQVVAKLKASNYSGAIVPVRLPEEVDPGSLDPTILSDYIVSAADNIGINLLNLKRAAKDVDVSRERTDTGNPSAVNRLRRELGIGGSVPQYSFDS